MPYVKSEVRHKIGLSLLHVPADVGELTYCFAAIINEYIKRKGLKYQTIAEVVGALEGAKLDFNNCTIQIYESCKAMMNGEVYDPSIWDEFNKEYNKWSEEQP